MSNPLDLDTAIFLLKLQPKMLLDMMRLHPNQTLHIVKLHPKLLLKLLELPPKLLLSSLFDPSRSSPLPWILLGFLFHSLGSRLLLPAPPPTVLASSDRLWKWRTTYMSKISAGLSGVSALLSICCSPDMRDDLMFTSAPSSTRLVAFSVGVHLAESCDMLAQSQLSMLLVHHAFVIVCFSGALYKKMAVGFATLSLVTEINSVFNKTRILHLVSGLSHASQDFKINSRLNLATFTIRMAIIAWMNRRSFSYYGVLPLSFLLPSIIGTSIINFWNISVFRQLLARDLGANVTFTRNIIQGR